LVCESNRGTAAWRAEQQGGLLGPVSALVSLVTPDVSDAF
jgi:hypothetical protein